MIQECCDLVTNLKVSLTAVAKQFYKVNFVAVGNRNHRRVCCMNVVPPVGIIAYYILLTGTLLCTSCICALKFQNFRTYSLYFHWHFSVLSASWLSECFHCFSSYFKLSLTIVLFTHHCISYQFRDSVADKKGDHGKINHKQLISYMKILSWTFFQQPHLPDNICCLFVF